MSQEHFVMDFGEICDKAQEAFARVREHCESEVRRLEEIYKTAREKLLGHLDRLSRAEALFFESPENGKKTEESFASNGKTLPPKRSASETNVHDDVLLAVAALSENGHYPSARAIRLWLVQRNKRYANEPKTRLCMRIVHLLKRGCLSIKTPRSRGQRQTYSITDTGRHRINGTTVVKPESKISHKVLFANQVLRCMARLEEENVSSTALTVCNRIEFGPSGIGPDLKDVQMAIAVLRNSGHITSISGGFVGGYRSYKISDKGRRRLNGMKEDDPQEVVQEVKLPSKAQRVAHLQKILNGNSRS